MKSSKDRRSPKKNVVKSTRAKSPKKCVVKLKAAMSPKKNLVKSTRAKSHRKCVAELKAASSPTDDASSQEKASKGTPKQTGLTLPPTCPSTTYFRQRELTLKPLIHTDIFPASQMRIGGVQPFWMLGLLSIKNKIASLSFRKRNDFFTRINNAKKNGQFCMLNSTATVWHDHVFIGGGQDLRARAVNALTDHIKDKLRSVIPKNERQKIEYQDVNIGLILTSSPGNQPAHRDFGDIGKMQSEIYAPWVLHLPLCKEGLYLRVWTFPKKHVEKTAIEGWCCFMVHVPFGAFLLLRGDVVHSGVYGAPGNLRFHAVFTTCPLDSKKLEIKSDEIPYDYLNKMKCSPNVMQITYPENEYADKLINRSFGMIPQEWLTNIPMEQQRISSSTVTESKKTESKKTKKSSKKSLRSMSTASQMNDKARTTGEI